MKLYEVYSGTLLLEYNRSVTLKNLGDKIAQSAQFHGLYMDDMWFDAHPELKYKNDKVDPVELQNLATAVLGELENIDPTKNKQYVLTLVRWYTNVLKKHKELDNMYNDWHQEVKDEVEADRGPGPWMSDYPEDYRDLIDYQDEFDAFDDDFGHYSLDAENMQTFKLEDAEQVQDALKKFHEIKQNLPQDRRDINRFPNFYDFEDYIDGVTSGEKVSPVDSELLNSDQVKVVYNGPLGLVAIPRTYEASCELGKGTKWCTAGRERSWYDSYSKQGDLIIYHEKPGKQKYQFHVKAGASGPQIEARDARDREITISDLHRFEHNHPVLSKLIAQKKVEVLEKYRNAPYNENDSLNPERLAQTLLKHNNQVGGGVFRWLDEYFLATSISYFPKQLNNNLVNYMLDRGQRWPEMEKKYLEYVKIVHNKIGFVNPGPNSPNASNPKLKTANRLVQQIEPYAKLYPDFNKKLQALVDKFIQDIQRTQQ